MDRYLLFRKELFTTALPFNFNNIVTFTEYGKGKFLSGYVLGRVSWSCHFGDEFPFQFFGRMTALCI